MDDAKKRHAQLGVFVLRLFPMIVQLILKDNITPGKLKRMFLDKTLNTALTDTDIGLMKMLPNMDSFTIEICYKILRFENLIGEPRCKWGNIPHETELAIADDIQRILNASNEVITKTSDEITKIFRDSFDDNVKRIIERVDAYLNGDTCRRSYQNLHFQQIAVSELLEILEEIIKTHPIKVIPSVMTTVGKNVMRELYSRTAIVITDIFPNILRDILRKTICPHDLYKKCDTKFLSSCFSDQRTYLKTLKLQNSFSFLDIPIIYKLLRHFSLIPPPSKGWGTAPDPTDRLLADDVERIRTLRNEIAHRCDANIDKNICDAFFVKFSEIGERIDIHFTGQTNYEQKVIDCRVCPMDIQMQTKYENAVKELENLKLHYKRKPVNFYWGDTFEKNLMNLQTMFKQEKLEGNEKFRVQIVLQTESDMNDKTVSILNSLRDEINQGLNGIDFVVASSGSIVLCVDIMVDEMQTDEKMQLVLYSFMNTIIETKIISISSAGYVDVVLIYSEENTFFEMTKKETVTSSVVNLDFDIDARHFETDEQMKAALIDIVDNVYKKSNGSGTTGEIKATVMPLEFDFAEEIVSELKEYDKSTQENTDTRHDPDHFDADIKYEKKDQGNADLCDYSEEQVTYGQVAKEHMKGQVIQENRKLHIAARRGDVQKFEKLLNQNHNPDTQNGQMETALHIAAKKGDTAITKLLVDWQCNPHLKNCQNKTARDLAMYSNLDDSKEEIEGKQEIQTLLQDYEKTYLLDLPMEVRKLDKISAKVFCSLLEEESYLHFESRVMFVGEAGTGKTVLARYLVGKRPTKFRLSTDGIELYNGLSYMDLETKDWLSGLQDFSLEDITVSRFLLREDKRKKNIKLPDTSSTSQDLSDMTEDASTWASEGDITYKSNESPSSNALSSSQSSVKKYENVMTLSEHHCQILPDYASSTVMHMHKKSPGHVSGQTSNIQDKDDAHETAVLATRSSSERQSERLVFGGNSAVDSVNMNERVAPNCTTRQENTDAANDTQISEVPFDKFKPRNDSHDASIKSGFTGDLHLETFTEGAVIKKLKRFFGITKQVNEVKVSITKEKVLEKSSKVGKKKLHNKKIAPILIWDFGGQDVFYSTHQTFLTYRAIYIIVLDGSRKLDDSCPYEQYLPGKSGHKTSRDYLLFWINTIVTYCKGGIRGFPKIMVVLTHKDQVSANEVDTRRRNIFTEIYQMFDKTPLMQQLVIEDQIFVNAKDKYDPEMAKIKAVIIRESERQPTWGEPLPKCFIPLELEFASLIRLNIPLITLEHLNKINLSQPIRPLSEVELKVFLKFQHSIGKLLYFDEHKLDDRIILSPTLLIDAFKSIVTDRRFCEGDKKREEIWDAMGKKGVVSKQAIEGIWKRKKYVKFYKDKDYLLNVMTHLDILVEPKRYGFDHKRIPADFYYVASMVQAIDDSGYLQSAGITKRSIAIAFLSSSVMIPPALSFRFISYCLYVWAVKTYGEVNRDMIFHRSGVFTIDPSVDMHVFCEDDRIVVRLVHAETNTLITRDLASSVKECLESALEKISQLYIKSSSDESQHIDASFITSICCNSPDNPCILPLPRLADLDNIWICPCHGIEHNIHTITSWFARKNEENCEPGCPVTNDDFLKVTPSDLHLRRLSLLFSKNEVREIAIIIGLSTEYLGNILETDDPRKWNFEVLRRCRDNIAVTFKHIKRAMETSRRENIHILCKLVKADSIDFEKEADKWDIVPTEEHIDRLAPLVGNHSLPFLIELGMDFQTWEQIIHRKNEQDLHDLVRLNKDILEKWRFQFCKMHNLKPTLRNVANAFINIGKNVQIVEKTLSDLF